MDAVFHGAALFKIADEHLIQAHGVRAVVAARYRPGSPRCRGILDIFSPFSPRIMPWLVRFCIRLRGGHHADVVQELVPEAAVQQVQRGVLHAAVVPVHRASSIPAPPGWPAPCRCAGPCSAGSTRTSPPTGAWCPSPAWRGRRSAGRWCSPSRSCAASGRFAVVGRLIRSFTSGSASGSSLSGSGTQPHFSQYTIGIGSPQ